MKTIGLVINSSREKAATIARRLISLLEAKGISVRLPDEDALYLDRSDIGLVDDSFPEGLDLIIVLGGDGTVLRAARLLNGRATPLLGVNLGRFGFLAEIEEDKLEVTIDQVINNQFAVEKRMMISGEIVSGPSIKKVLALNEVVIEKGLHPKLLEIDVSINGQFFNRYACDGLILATPTGSTAYSLSASGPIVSPETRLILMTPISPHSFFNRPVILSERDTIEVTVPDAGEKKVVVNADGNVLVKEDRLDKLVVRVSPHDLSLVRLKKESFYQTLRKKLKNWDSVSG